MWKRQNGIGKRLKKKVEKIRLRLFQFVFVRFAFNVAQSIGKDYVGIMSAGISYYSFLSLFPLAIGIVSILGYLLPSEDIYNVVFEFLNRVIPVPTDILESTIKTTIEYRGTLGIISIIGLLIAGTAVLSAISQAINRTWGLRPRPYLKRKPLELAMVLSMGLIILLLLIVAAFLSYLDTLTFPGINFIEVSLSRLVSFVMLFSIFLFLYKLTPRTKVFWQDIWRGALFGAIAFQLALIGFTIFIRRFADYELVYGSLASIVTILVWMYICAFILVLSAEINAVYYFMFKQHSKETLPNSQTLSDNYRSGTSTDH